MENCDSSIDGQLNMVLEGSLKLLTTLSLATFVMPVVVIPAALIATQYVRIAQYFQLSVRELKRLSSTTRSPIFAHFSETLTGCSTIRAFGDGKRFMATHVRFFEEHSRAWLCLQGAQRWLMIRMSVYGACLLFFVSLWAAMFRGSLSPALVGLVSTCSTLPTSSV